MLSIYKQIVSRFSHMRDNCIPISDVSNEFGFVVVDPKEDGEFYRAERKEGKEIIVIRIWGSNHSGELQFKKDTYHNEIEYIDANGKNHSSEYMYLMD